ncbi:MAG: hypothetical protein HY608_07550 [Planctomycetes bacterium]|nr:hypothetical protein [Planctomycetota bacterium]
MRTPGPRPHTCSTCGVTYDLSGVPPGFAAACPGCRTPAAPSGGGSGGIRAAMIGGAVLAAGALLFGIYLLASGPHAVEGAWVGQMEWPGEPKPRVLSFYFERAGDDSFRGTASVAIITEPTIPIVQMLEAEVREGKFVGGTVRFTLRFDGSFGHDDEVSFEGEFTRGGEKIEGTWSAGAGASGTFSIRTVESATAPAPEGSRREEAPVEAAPPLPPAPVEGGYNPGGKFRHSYGLGVVLDGACRVLRVEPGSPAEGCGVTVGMQLALDQRAGTWDFNRSAFEWMADQNGPGSPVLLYRYSGDFGDGTNFTVDRVDLR